MKNKRSWKNITKRINWQCHYWHKQLLEFVYTSKYQSRIKCSQLLADDRQKRILSKHRPSIHSARAETYITLLGILSGVGSPEVFGNSGFFWKTQRRVLAAVWKWSLDAFKDTQEWRGWIPMQTLHFIGQSGELTA